MRIKIYIYFSCASSYQQLVIVESFEPFFPEKVQLVHELCLLRSEISTDIPSLKPFSDIFHQTKFR